MHIVHIALQGCLKAGAVEYGVTADTGGHIRYLLDLVDALEHHPQVSRQTIVTRGFVEPCLGAAYANPRERYSERTEIVRLFGQVRGYLSKEALHCDIQPLVGAFLEHLRTGPALPEIIHAHYADAGTLAFAAKARFAIPFIFTAHSLGRVKRLMMQSSGTAASAGSAGGNVLQRREAVEDQAIGAADLIIASSRDEAEFQYGGYPSMRPERIRINPPGCALEAFTRPTASRSGVLERIDQALDNPTRPPILAIARPVMRKNLIGLMRAYANDPWLREHANLVIVAGSSHETTMLSEENKAVLDELSEGVIRWGLEGKVALPTHHEAREVPAIYARARALSGVFANPALHEPFGLTLIEAAAAGLPVVATSQGGPRDILAWCRHGLMVDPSDDAAIAQALASLLKDHERRERYAQAGRVNVRTYTWKRHAELYVRDARRLMRPKRPILAGQNHTSLLLSDIDNTLIGCPDGLTRFKRWLGERPAVLFGVATGRSLHDAISVLQREGVEAPAVMVTSVGSEIYYTTDADYSVVRDEEYDRNIADDWDPDAIVECLSRDPRLSPQPAIEQRRFKRSWFATLSDEDVAGVEAQLDDAGLPASVIYSHGRYLDVLPNRASKGRALRFLQRKFAIPSYATAAAGDSGNDRDLLTSAARGIVVANHNGELDGLLKLANVRLSRASHAGGIVEQLDGWPPLRAPDAISVPLHAMRDLWAGDDRP